MVELGTRCTTERVQTGNSPPTAARATFLSRQPHAAFDVAGAGNVAMAELCTHSAIERAGLETLHLQPARLPSTLLEGGRWKRAARHLAGGLPYGTHGFEDQREGRPSR